MLKKLLTFSSVTFSILLSLSALPPGASQPLAVKPATPQSEDQGEDPFRMANEPQRVFLPYWSTEAGFSTVIYIRNVQVDRPLTAEVTLVLNDRRIRLPERRVAALQTVAVDVGEALLEAGQRPEQSGGGEIFFTAPSTGAVNAYGLVLNPVKSYNLTLPFLHRVSAARKQLQGMMLYESDRSQAFVALQNTSRFERKVRPQVFVSGQRVELPEVTLAPHAIARLRLPTAADLGLPFGPQAVGVRLDPVGLSLPGDVVAQGWVLDETLGFSVLAHFKPVAACECRAYLHHRYGTGVLIGEAGKSLGLPAGTRFSPMLALWNASDRRLRLQPLFSYETETKPQSVELPAVSLQPRETRLVNLLEYQDQRLIPADVTEGSLDLQYRGEPKALLAELVSLDDGGSFAAQVPLQCSPYRALHMSFWRTDGPWKSLIAVQNVAREMNEVEVTIAYPGGEYQLVERLRAGETRLISINQLQRQQIPDGRRRVLPADVTLGGVNIWSRNQDQGLVINPMILNPETGTCGSCWGSGWVTWYCLSDQVGSSCAFTRPRPVGYSLTLYAILFWSTSTTSIASIGSSSSSDPSVAATVGSSVSCQGPGTTTLSGTTSISYPIDGSCANWHRLTA